MWKEAEMPIFLSFTGRLCFNMALLHLQYLLSFTLQHWMEKENQVPGSSPPANSRHGGNDVLYGYIHSLDYVVDDLYLQKSYLEKVLSEKPGMPCFLFRHSTGGVIVLKFVSKEGDIVMLGTKVAIMSKSASTDTHVAPSEDKSVKDAPQPPPPIKKEEDKPKAKVEVAIKEMPKASSPAPSKIAASKPQLPLKERERRDQIDTLTKANFGGKAFIS
ncbi:dihydrolipoyllysine-residue succinyltransferase component of 2-oxoglutarate dehydrogenase complex 1, mitochondrial-like [Iris pallida]|uniref:Dihydrolipoyllysine-residue succinyltransferase component of 2-oxoglutarate dehydrogenase complex 1, mitochondrial-like n=1 Tax=Iris pallida TaxID=29817 RepID=A0AAX6HHJ4_IRIPA|nr:dihydrolipoyllysine-residue succinyltransferase component of 2-oxoglutarate dehydrogenase complex 1, mitochondrial-like [Iris pallida]